MRVQLSSRVLAWLGRCLLVTLWIAVASCTFPKPPDVDPDGGAVDMFEVSAPSAAWVRLDGTVEVTVTIVRAQGFAGAVDITAQGLPTGVTASPLTIASGQPSGVLVLSAQPGAGAIAGGPTPVTIVGAAGSVQRMTSLALVVAGPAGTLDRTFGLDGAALDGSAGLQTAFVQGTSIVTVLTCASPSSSELRRFTSEGTLDSSFGSAGVLTTDFAAVGASGVACATAAPDSMERIWIVASADGDSSSAVRRDIFVRRVSRNGTADVFSDRHLRFGTRSMNVSHVAVSPTDEVYVAGTFAVDASRSDAFVLRLDAAGMPDATFGPEGLQILSFDDVDVVSGLAIAPGGDVVVAMSSGLGFAALPRLVRLRHVGGLDASFAGDGALEMVPITPGATYFIALSGVSVQANGLIQLWGSVWIGDGVKSDAAIWRITAAGAPDATFSGDGVWRHSTGEADAVSVLAYDEGFGYLGAGLRVDADNIGTSLGLVLYRLDGEGNGLADFGSGGVLNTTVAFAAAGVGAIIPIERRFTTTGRVHGFTGTEKVGALRFWF